MTSTDREPYYIEQRSISEAIMKTRFKLGLFSDI